MATTTGMDLRLQRVAADVSIKDLATAMRRSRATLHRWERLAKVDPKDATHYLEALETFRDVAAVPEAA